MYNSRALFFILTIMLSGVANALAPQVEADRLLLAAKSSVDEGHYRDAAEYFSKLRKLNASIPNEYYYYYGKVQFRVGAPEQTLNLLEEYFIDAVKLNKNYNEGLALYTAAKAAINKKARLFSEETRKIVDNLEKQMVTIPGQGYAIGKFEITQGQWKGIMGSNTAHFSQCGTDCPMEQLSWYDVRDFITKLNQLSNYTYHLPTGKEWEIACLAGKETLYCGSDTAVEVARVAENSNDKPQPVGKKLANAWGLYDMSGNVWEWVNECYRKDCIMRGGSWFNKPIVARSGGSHWIDPSKRLNNVGFRLARVL